MFFGNHGELRPIFWGEKKIHCCFFREQLYEQCPSSPLIRLVIDLLLPFFSFLLIRKLVLHVWLLDVESYIYIYIL